jgi:methylmalonyl-CoA/ethylmalonyl-CoA epimerase
MIIDHICYAIKDLNEGISYWHETFGYNQMTEIIENKIHKVKVVFLHKEGSIMIKLIEPITGNDSLKNFTSHGGGFHHLCFRCENLGRAIEELSAKGLRLISPPAPGEAFENNDIAFMLAKYGMNIELIDTEKKSALIALSV